MMLNVGVECEARAPAQGSLLHTQSIGGLFLFGEGSIGRRRRFCPPNVPQWQKPSTREGGQSGRQLASEQISHWTTRSSCRRTARHNALWTCTAAPLFWGGTLKISIGLLDSQYQGFRPRPHVLRSNKIEAWASKLPARERGWSGRDWEIPCRGGRVFYLG